VQEVAVLDPRSFELFLLKPILLFFFENLIPSLELTRPWKIGLLKGKGSSCNHPFSGAMLVLGMHTLPPTIMEVENGALEDEFHLGRAGHFTPSKRVFEQLLPFIVALRWVLEMTPQVTLSVYPENLRGLTLKTCGRMCWRQKGDSENQCHEKAFLKPSKMLRLYYGV